MVLPCVGLASPKRLCSFVHRVTRELNAVLKHTVGCGGGTAKGAGLVSPNPSLTGNSGLVSEVGLSMLHSAEMGSALGR